MNQTKELYQPFPSKAKNKKYSVYVKGDTKSGKKLIHFGDNRYEQFQDKLGTYKKLDHNDPKRKKAYYDRHGKATSKDTAKYFSHKYLW
jgi:hypothetical protein|tara:strand:+ start:8632 stop:8898 length:267 start_codon:yes stop_codon:yes gene_type:complete